jgi:TolA-binding protein
MRQASGMRYLVVLAAVLFLAACDPYAYYPARSKTVTPPPGSGGAPPVQPAPTAAPPDLAQQVRSLEARVQQLEARVAETEAQGPAPPARAGRHAPERPSARGTAPPPGYPPPATASEKLYVEAYRLYQKKKYPAARDKFAKYLRSQPRGAKAPDARFYTAYSFVHEGKHKEAAVEFNKLVNQFPKSNLAPAALKQQALAYKADNHPKLYQNTLKKLAHAYPRSPEAREAQKLLKEGAR